MWTNLYDVLTRTSVRAALLALAAVHAGPGVAADLADTFGATGLSTQLSSIGTAEAAIIRRSSIKNVNNGNYNLHITTDNYTQLTAIKAKIESDADGEEVSLTRSGAWLHGAAAIAALPNTDAALQLIVRDFGGVALMSYSGTLGADGSVALTADATKQSVSSCASKLGCVDDTDGEIAASLDIALLGGETFPASKGLTLGIDLAGADVGKVAYAEVVWVESTEVTTCSKVNGCTTTGSATTAKAGVAWDAIGAVWQAQLSTRPAGVIDLKVQAYDGQGETLDTAKSALGVPWLDGGNGVNALAIDEDPLTTIALLANPKYQVKQFHFHAPSAMVVVSNGWQIGEAIPTHAEVEFTSGEPITIPVNSYQRRGRGKAWMVNNFEVHTFFKLGTVLSVSAGNLKIAKIKAIDLARPVCANGTCVALVTNLDGTSRLSVSEYGPDAGTLANQIDVNVTSSDEGGVATTYDTMRVEFDADIAAVFANEILFGQDPIGLGVSGKVRLLGAANKNGNQKTLAKGRFVGNVARDEDGDLGLAGAGKAAVSFPDALILPGVALISELKTDTDQDGGINAPPVTPMFSSEPGDKSDASWFEWSSVSERPEML